MLDAKPTRIPIKEIHVRPSTIYLADGTVIEFTAQVVEVFRLPGKTDSSGQPSFSMKTATTVSIVSMPTNGHIKPKLAQVP